jgi:hypothetical protein
MIGQCFYHDTLPNGRHLFVVLAPDLEQKGWFVCANITTQKDDSENTDFSCVLRRGEHQELTAPVSIVVYAEARSMPPPLIKRLMGEQKLPPFEGDLLLRIQKAPLSDNSRLKKGFQKSIKQHLEGGPRRGQLSTHQLLRIIKLLPLIGQ